MKHRFPDTFWVVGTDTEVGKTVVSAGLCLGLGKNYLKPVQSGTKGGTDTNRVRSWTGLEKSLIKEEFYVLQEPLSPHLSARIDGVSINLKTILSGLRPLNDTLIESAGGLLVPMSEDLLQIELIQASKLPVVLVTRTTLGTINHSLLSVQALEAYDIELNAIIMNGEYNEENFKAIELFTDDVPILEFPHLNQLDRVALLKGFNAMMERPAYS